MNITTINYKNIISDSNILKPNYHLNFGKKRISNVIRNGKHYLPLSDLTDNIYTGGIFKRVFVNNKNYGLPYISAQHMVNSDPLDVSKLISKKFTPRQDDMTLKENQILMSCAGTVGIVRLISSDMDGIIGSQDIIRINPNNQKAPYGFLYAYLASPTVYNYIQSYIYGSVVPRIEPNTLARLPVLIFNNNLKEETHKLILESTNLRVKANIIIKKQREILKQKAQLKDLQPEEYEYFGFYNSTREISTFSRNIKEISSVSINAFNYSKKIECLEDRVKMNHWKLLIDCLDDSKFFSTGSFKRLEIDSENSIKLINQSDIFNTNKTGKLLAKRFIPKEKMVEYGEVLVAGVGTLGENETFCRAIFANEELAGQLVSGEFIRMNTKDEIPSGYLYAWLSSDYGFRFIRKTQTGTKLCRPIQVLLGKIPVPILSDKVMHEIDNKIKEAHTLLFNALTLEKQAISIIENEIESWQE